MKTERTQIPQIELETFRRGQSYNRDGDTNRQLQHTIREINHVNMRAGCIMLDTGCKAPAASTDWHEAMSNMVKDRGYKSIQSKLQS